MPILGTVASGFTAPPTPTVDYLVVAGGGSGYGNNGQGGGDQIEFWTESKIDDIPNMLTTLKLFIKQMK
jgi:hypothetical protein